MRVSLFVLSSVLVLTATAASAQNFECANPDGLHPVVATEDAAKTIYRAVATGRGDRLKDNIVVQDGGAYWSVYQFTPPTSSVDGNGRPTITLISGAGELMLSIDKCEGTIEAHYSR